ncbi:PREDICTED: 24-hydroxycholesterol 7-alpha-hydroxylase-like [Elephantulus edwardii]|uniref:24-hydroxycholesterol 7-alpha-hydroxylase-like n=1 Tax=Elephantulus edwardii TaxID=28737 RepID=UPI0003F0E901|nr:PREDICTED: 24-hydroxycholesterol 7-alpha-hydroxylase-like [Elephantulus edwardii]
MELVSPTVIILLGCVVFLLLLQWKNLRGPPCIGGWIPWIGAGFEFGKAPLEFIEKARIKYGPIFTIFVMGHRMTFVTEEEGINVFLKSKNVDFELAVQQPIYRTASIPEKVFLALHEKIFVVLKGKLGAFNIYQLSEQLTDELHGQLENLGTHGTIDLVNLVRHVLYPATTSILFKKDFIPTNKSETKKFYQHFQTYDESFEYGSQLPECFLRNWSKSKQWILALFDESIPDIKTSRPSKPEAMTAMQVILDILNVEEYEHKSSNYGLLFLWASLSNTVPVAIWTLAFILSHPDIHKTVMEDISSVFGPAGKDKIKVSEEDLNKLYLIKWCILETIRLKAPGVITRKVVKPIKILNYTVPSGDLLMLSPFWLHRNPKYFPDPESFKPERWEKANIEKRIFLESFIAFGSGKYQCPGRWFALLEIHTLIILILYKYDCSLLDPIPKQSFQHLVGIQQPEGQCRMEYKQRK